MDLHIYMSIYINVVNSPIEALKTQMNFKLFCLKFKHIQKSEKIKSYHCKIVFLNVKSI